MKPVAFYLVTFLVSGSIAVAQSSDSTQRFDVASVKSVMRDVGPYYFVMRGGPGTNTPTQFSCEAAPLSKLLMRAYGIKRYQIQGPSWLDIAKYDVVAKFRAGTSEAEFRLMLQDLLVERFAAIMENTKKELPIYELRVAKNGPKLTPSSPDQEPSGDPLERSTGVTPSGTFGGAPAHSKTKLDANGYPERADLPDGRAALGILNGKAKLVAKKESMESLAERLEFHLERRVVDLTGLEGTYAFTLFWVVESVLGSNSPGRSNEPVAAAGPTLFEALRMQLGLDLQPRKGPIEVLVVRHIERNPTEN